MGNIGPERRRYEVLPLREPATAPRPAAPPSPAPPPASPASPAPTEPARAPAPAP